MLQHWLLLLRFEDLRRPPQTGFTDAFIQGQGATCPDGWSKVEVNDAVECVYFGGLYEGVTKADAEVLCAARGGHLVDMDESRGPAKNNAIKALLSDVVPSEPGRPGMQ